MQGKNNYILGMFSGLILGVLAGWVINTLIKERNPRIKQRFKKIIGNDNKRKIKEIFGEVSDDAVEIYQEVRRELMKKLRETESAFNKLDERNYIYAVQDTIRDIQRKISLPDDQAERLQEDLENDYEMIKNEIRKLKEE